MYNFREPLLQVKLLIYRNSINLRRKQKLLKSHLINLEHQAHRALEPTMQIKIREKEFLQNQELQELQQLLDLQVYQVLQIQIKSHQIPAVQVVLMAVEMQWLMLQQVLVEVLQR